MVLSLGELVSNRNGTYFGKLAEDVVFYNELHEEGSYVIVDITEGYVYFVNDEINKFNLDEEGFGIKRFEYSQYGFKKFNSNETEVFWAIQKPTWSLYETMKFEIEDKISTTKVLHAGTLITSSFRCSTGLKTDYEKFIIEGEHLDRKDVCYIEGYGITKATDRIKEKYNVGYVSRTAKLKHTSNSDYVKIKVGSNDEYEFESYTKSYSHIFFRCKHCNKIYFRGIFAEDVCLEPTYISGNTYCNECVAEMVSDGEVIKCDNCNSYILAERSEVVRGRTVCECCAEDLRNSYINSYSYKPEPVFGYVGVNGELRSCSRSQSLSSIPYGIEWELNNTENGGATAEYITEKATINGRERIYVKHDGSLRDEGIECVFHPMTIEYIEKSDVFNAVEVGARIYDAEDSPECAGIHIHVPREKIYDINSPREARMTIGKLDRYFSNNKSDVIDFCRRDKNVLDYCIFPDELNFEDDAIEDKYNGYFSNHQRNRYMCVNNTNRDTIEFRMFGSTLDAKVAKMYVKYLDTLIDLLKNLSDEEFYSLRHEKVIEKMIEKHYGGNNEEVCNLIVKYGLDIERRVNNNVCNLF